MTALGLTGLLLGPIACGAAATDGWAEGGPGEADVAAAGALGTLRSGILAGTLAEAQDFGATGAILYTSRRPGRDDVALGAMVCSGTLIAPDVVLAAGHCQERGLDSDQDAERAFYFSLDRDVSTFGPHVQALPPDAVRVAHVEMHPAYGSARDARAADEGVADLALFYLASAVPEITPAQLLPAAERCALTAGSAVTIVGYGRRNLYFLGAGDGGRKTLGQSTLHSVRAFELQVGLGPADAYKCWGDSGGPTFLAGAGGAMRLVGITSRAADLGGCRSGGIDTRVDAYRSWIDARMEAACDAGLRPDCAADWRVLPP